MPRDAMRHMTWFALFGMLRSIRNFNHFNVRFKNCKLLVILHHIFCCNPKRWLQLTCANATQIRRSSKSP